MPRSLVPCLPGRVVGSCLASCLSVALVLAQGPLAPPTGPSKGPAVGLPAVINVRNVTTGESSLLGFKQSGLNSAPAAPRLEPLPGPGALLVTPEALHWKSTTSWRLRTPAVSPGPRLGHTMAFDPVRQTVLLHGGAFAGELGDLWEWNGTNWSLLSPPIPTPGPRSSAAMASITGGMPRVLLFGGSSVGTTLQDTWLWNGTAWSQVATPPLLVARRDHAMAYHATANRVVLFGGFPSIFPASQLGDTWVFDPTGIWQQNGGPGPSARGGHAMAYDSARQRVVLFGGYRTGTGVLDDTWEWGAGGWTQSAPVHRPSARSGHKMAYDSVRQRVVLTGGGFSGSACDTWEWDGVDWVEQLPTPTLQGRVHHAMAFDAARATAVLFGGIYLGPGLFASDTWTRDGAAQTLAVNDFSLGLDFIPVAPDMSGVLTVSVPFHCWIGMAFSVTADTVGEQGLLIAQEASTNRAGADLFSYVFPGSDSFCIPQAEIGVVRRAVDSTEGTTQTEDNVLDVKGLDLFLPAYDLQPNLLLDPPPSQPFLYFTVSRNELSKAPSSWWAGSTPSAATILRTQWSSSTHTWSSPQIWLLYSDLQAGGNPLTSDEEIDALMIGDNGPPTTPPSRPHYLAFSTNRQRPNNQLTAMTDQLMIADVFALPASPITSAVALEYLNEQSVRTSVSRALGIGSGGDVDAACGWDPCTPMPGRQTFLRYFGICKDPPLFGFLGWPRIEAGAYRDNIAGVDTLRTFTTGGSRPGFCLLFLSDALVTPGSFVMLGVVATGPVPSSAAAFSIPIPPGLVGSGPLGLHWIDVDLGATTVQRASVLVTF